MSRETPSRATPRDLISGYAAWKSAAWRMLPGEDRSASLVLEDLLDAQSRAAVAQNNFVQAQVNHMLALVELKRAQGTLLQYEQITLHRTNTGCLPDMMISRTPNTDN